VQRGGGRASREKRWVIYDGEPEASKVIGLAPPGITETATTASAVRSRGSSTFHSSRAGSTRRAAGLCVFGTQIGTGRLSTGWDGVGSRRSLVAGEPHETLHFGPQWDGSGRREAHFETAPFDRSGTSAVIASECAVSGAADDRIK
jgi:hypothetical protein